MELLMLVSYQTKNTFAIQNAPSLKGILSNCGLGRFIFYFNAITGLTNYHVSHSLLPSAFLDQYWCKFEFGEAYRLVIDEGRRNYIVVVLVEKPTRNKLTPELNAYLKAHTYIDATNYEHDLETVRKRIRFAMPNIPLKQIKVRTTLQQHQIPSYISHKYQWIILSNLPIILLFG